MSGKNENSANFLMAGYIRVTRCKEFLDEAEVIYLHVDEISYVTVNRHNNKVKLVMKSKFGIEVNESALEVSEKMASARHRSK